MYLLLAAVLCAVLYFGVVWPLWFFATTNSRLYSTLVISAAVLFVFFILIRSFIRRYKAAGSPEGRKKFLLRQLFTTICVLSAVVSIILAILYVLSEQRLVAFFILAAGTILTVILHKYKARFSDV